MDTEKESCLTKTDLLIIWHKAAQMYSKTVVSLSRQMEKVSKNDYDRLQKAAERALHRSVEAQERLAAHVLEHG
jgi:hypothetical protein